MLNITFGFDWPSSLKMVDDDGWTSGTCLSYKITSVAYNSGELKIKVNMPAIFIQFNFWGHE